MPPRDRSLLPGSVVQTALQRSPGFHLGNNGHLQCRWRFPDFAGAFAFVTKVAQLAERQNHHPDINLGWGYAAIDLWTHDRAGITQKDLDLVAAIDALGQAPEPRPQQST